MQRVHLEGNRAKGERGQTERGNNVAKLRGREERCKRGQEEMMKRMRADGQDRLGQTEIKAQDRGLFLPSPTRQTSSYSGSIDSTQCHAS